MLILMEKDTDGSIIDPKHGIDLMEKPKQKLQAPRMYNVVLLNDDFTPMDFVAFLLTKIFHKSHQEAELVTMEIHHKGKGIAGTYTHEVAEQKLIETMGMAKLEQHPLQGKIEQA